LRDCATVLTADDKSSKAYYRSAQALLSLDRIEEALDCCDRCLSYDAGNEGMKTLRDRIAKVKEEGDKKERQRQERIQKEKEEKLAMEAAFRVSAVEHVCDEQRQMTCVSICL